MLVAGHALGASGGHCDNGGFPHQRFGAEPGIAGGIASGPDQFRDAVRFQVKYGADVIKVCATGGVLSLGDDVGAPQVTQPEMDALVDEAHRLNRRARRRYGTMTGRQSDRRLPGIRRCQTRNAADTSASHARRVHHGGPGSLFRRPLRVTRRRSRRSRRSAFRPPLPPCRVEGDNPPIAQQVACQSIMLGKTCD